MTRTVSIVMPCCDGGVIIRDSVDSALAQTGCNVELLIVDDGSTDAATLQTLQSLRDRRIRVFHQANAGPAAARNRAIREAAGEYVLPLDADDLMDPTYAAKAAAVLDAHSDVGIVYCKADKFGAESGSWDMPPYADDVLALVNVIFVSAMFRKSDWLTVGGFDESLRHGLEDYDFWIKLVAHGRRVVQLDETLFHYRVRENSRTSMFEMDEVRKVSTLATIFRNNIGFFANHAETLFRHRQALVQQRDDARDRYETLRGALSTGDADWPARLDAVRQESESRLARVRDTSAAQLEAMRIADVAQRQKIVELRGDLARQNAHIAVLEHMKDELEQIRNSRSWRWTRPLRFLLRTLRHRGLTADDRCRLGFGRMGLSKPPADAFPQQESRPPLQDQRDGYRDYYQWAVIDWHFRIQRPQHMARELANAGNRVFYISNNFVDRVEPGFRVEPLGEEGRIFQINLYLKGAPAIYDKPPGPDELRQLRASLGMVLAWTGSSGCVSLVQHPYWFELAAILPDSRLVYDCMDHHGGFAGNTRTVIEHERELMRRADLLVVTSSWLDKETVRYNSHRALIRNAGEFAHFHEPPVECFKDSRGRRVLGYYGAIAEWFDLDLARAIACHFPDCLILLVGGDTIGAKRKLTEFSNIAFVGEVPYDDLPYYLYGFDVCMLPFQVIPLTLATNPVKLYEFLSAGKEVVAVDLPEMRQFDGLIRTANDHEEFLQAVADALATPVDASLVARRRAFAAQQTWKHRVVELVTALDQLTYPRVSVVVVTYNNLDFTKECLASLDRYSHYPDLELIIVDNASTDGTPVWLEEWAAQDENRQVIFNPDNRGFAAANNQGLAAATGDYLVMLNNDTHVTAGWVATMVNHLRGNPQLGMLGPVTNNIGNEAKIDLHYSDMDEMLRVAADYTHTHLGELTPLRTVAFFCVMMPRRVYEKVGELDEAFGIGMFEDDDYCRRVERAGWEIACAEDVFVHHHLSASFSRIKQERRQAMFEKNKAIYEAKWGPWIPHKYRDE